MSMPTPTRMGTTGIRTRGWFPGHIHIFTPMSKKSIPISTCPILITVIPTRPTPPGTGNPVQKKLIQVLTGWLILSLVYFAFYMALKEFHWQFVYYYIWLIGFGLPLYLFREKVTELIRGWGANRHLKFFLLGYGMVLLEEIFAALMNHLSEGFQPLLFLQRIGQFWFFNLLAFTGLIVAVWFLFTRFQYSFTEMFFLAGLTGLISERTIFLMPTNWAAFIVFAPIVTYTYGLILSPALMSVDIPSRRKIHFLLRMILVFILWYSLAQFPVLLLSVLRGQFPTLFPPCQFIPCG